MTEEEKKEIEKLKELCDEVLIEDNCYRYDSLSPFEKLSMVKIMLNLIEKQQKEIKKLERKIKIKDEYMKYARVSLLDYDGCYDRETGQGKIEDLADLIDYTREILGYAIESNDEVTIYERLDTGIELNILQEEIKGE